MMQFPNMIKLEKEAFIGTGELGAFVNVPLTRPDLLEIKDVLDKLLLKNAKSCNTPLWRKLSSLRARFNLVQLAVNHAISVSLPKGDVFK